MSDELKVIDASYDDESKTSITFTLLNNATGEKFPFGYILNSNDDSQITLWLSSLLKNKSVTVKPFELPVLTKEQLASSIRDHRNYLLSITDKYMTVSDYPVSETNREEIKAYRQALRDITKQSGFPENIVWPKEPDILK
jgi:hypothetical protein